MNYLVPYIPIALVVVAGVGFGIANLILGRLIGPRRENPNKSLAYESGMEPEGEANVRIPVKFYMVGLLFLLFDVEGAFILAWAVVFTGTGVEFESAWIPFTQAAFQSYALLMILPFMVMLVLAFIYEWRKGGLNW